MKIENFRRASVNQLAAVIDGRAFLIHAEEEIPSLDERGIKEAIKESDGIESAAESLAFFGVKLIAQ